MVRGALNLPASLRTCALINFYKLQKPKKHEKIINYAAGDPAAVVHLLRERRRTETIVKDPGRVVRNGLLQGQRVEIVDYCAASNP